MFSILHISDLHRSPHDPVDNATLMQALLNDADRYSVSASPIQRPDAIVISGDIVQGARLLQTDWENVIRDQYRNADDFIRRLADSFLDGDRSKVIIAPGNHDVCWNSAWLAMEEVPDDQVDEISINEYFSPNGEYRWNWRNRTAYQITDKDKYGSRCDAYWDFVENFYSGTALQGTISRSKGYNLFELNEGRILVASFESIHGNDCLAYHGAIPRKTISECALEIRKRKKHYELQIAVWHHGLYGPPGNTDYMDITTVNQMIGVGFQLGVHGHQHIAAMNAHYIHAPEKISVPIVSAGSLCAGARELPTGQNRQYNILQLDLERNKVLVHIRERGDGEQFRECMRPEFGVNGAIDMNYPPARDISGRLIDTDTENMRAKVEAFENAISNGKYSEAYDLIEKRNLEPDSYLRSLFVHTVLGQEDWAVLTEQISRPETLQELLGLSRALVELNEPEKSISLLREHVSKYPDNTAIIGDFIADIQTKLDMKNG